jgi:REP element-mobilizing transposase RayT
MSIPIRLSHNVSVLVYHFVCPAKYRRVVIDEQVDVVIKGTCQEIELRYDMRFLEIGTDGDHVHFLVQAVPKLAPGQIIRTIKSITAREVFAKCPQVKKKLWGGEFWTDGYYVGTVGQHGTEETVRKYVQNQGKEKEYHQLYVQQLSLF